MSSEAYHEPADELSPHTRELHRALVSIQEELEAVDWYQQRIDASNDEELKAILAHNRDEELEHASMMLEYVRRHVPKFDAALGTYLFKSGSIVRLEETATGKADAAVPSGKADGDGAGVGLGIGKLTREG